MCIHHHHPHPTPSIKEQILFFALVAASCLFIFYFFFPFCHHQTKNIHIITSAFVRCFANHFPFSWLNLLCTCVDTPKISTLSTSSVVLFVYSFPTLLLFNLSPSNLLVQLKHFGLKVTHTTTLQHVSN